MATISITDLYDFLTTKFDKEIAKNLTTFIDEKIISELENKSQAIASKQDISVLKEDLIKTESRLEASISTTRESVARSKAETIKWMFIFWIGQVAATFGFILLFLKK